MVLFQQRMNHVFFPTVQVWLNPTLLFNSYSYVIVQYLYWQGLPISGFGAISLSTVLYSKAREWLSCRLCMGTGDNCSGGRSRTQSSSPAGGSSCPGGSGRPCWQSWCGRGCSSGLPDTAGHRTVTCRPTCSNSPGAPDEWARETWSYYRRHQFPAIHITVDFNLKHWMILNDLLLQLLVYQHGLWNIIILGH